MLYKAFFRTYDTRFLVFLSFCIKSTGLIFEYMFASRTNLEWGIPDMVFLFFSDIIFNNFAYILLVLPIMAYFAKVTPSKIEGTIFAFLTGVMNLSYTLIAPATGTFINK